MSYAADGISPYPYTSQLVKSHLQGRTKLETIRFVFVDSLEHNPAPRGVGAEQDYLLIHRASDGAQ